MLGFLEEAAASKEALGVVGDAETQPVFPAPLLTRLLLYL